jgi:hypothetical protein
MVLVARVQRVLDHLERGEKAVDIVAFGELYFALGLFERWAHDHPDRSLRGVLKGPHAYRHAFGLLTAARHLAEDQNDIEFLLEDDANRMPDLRVRLDAGASVDTEVKAPQVLEYPREPLNADAAERIVLKAVAKARGAGGRHQLARDKDAVPVICGTGVLPNDLELLEMASRNELSRLAARGSRIVGIGISSPFVGLNPKRSIVFVAATRFVLNDAYEGRIRVGEGADSNRIQRVPDDQIRFGPIHEILGTPIVTDDAGDDSVDSIGD